MDRCAQAEATRINPHQPPGLWSRLIRVQNRALNTLEIICGATRVRSRPHEVQFGAEYRCNLRCIMCLATASRKAGWPTPMDRRLSTTAAGQFGKLVQLLPYLHRIALTGSGETLLCPDLAEILELLKMHGVAAAFVTNGQLLDRPKAELLVGMRLEELVISLDAAGKQTYESIRVGASWERLLAGIQVLNEVKREQGSDKPAITFAGNFMRLNIGELPAMVDFAAAHGAAGVWITKTIFYDRNLRDQDLKQCPELTHLMVTEAAERARLHAIVFNNWLNNRPRTVEPPGSAANPPQRTAARSPALRLRARFHALGQGRFFSLRRCFTDPGWLTATLSKMLRRIQRRLSRRLATGPTVTERLDLLKVCRNPWTGLAVWRDGSVRVCCMNSVLLGDLDTQSFAEIWNGPAARELRRSFLDSRPPEGCRNCHLVESGRRDGRLLPGATDLDDVRVPESNLQPSAERKLCYYLDRPKEGESLNGITELSGWVFAPAEIRQIRLLVDGQVAATALTGLHRPDVAKRLGTMNALSSGFQILLRTPAFGDGWHLIALRFTDRLGRTFDACHRTIRIVNTVEKSTVSHHPTSLLTSTSSSSNSGSAVPAADCVKTSVPSGPAFDSMVSPGS